MGKLRVAIRLALGGMLAAAAPLAAMPIGPYAAACSAESDRPAMLVRVTGFKARRGMLRVQSYGGDPARYFDKGTYLKRIDLPVPSSGPVEVCMPVPAPGNYAISVRHDVDGGGKTGMSDGGGMSGNPRLSLWAVITRSKPDPADVMVKVGKGVVPLTVLLNYVHDGAFGPLATASR